MKNKSNIIISDKATDKTFMLSQDTKIVVENGGEVIFCTIDAQKSAVSSEIITIKKGGSILSGTQIILNSSIYIIIGGDTVGPARILVGSENIITEVTDDFMSNDEVSTSNTIESSSEVDSISSISNIPEISNIVPSSVEGNVSNESPSVIGSTDFTDSSTN